MATENPKVSAYVPKSIKERLQQFRDENQSISESQAVIRILAEYFQIQISPDVSLKPYTPINLERIEALERKISELSELHSSSLSELNARIQTLADEVYKNQSLQTSSLVSSPSSRLPLFEYSSSQDTSVEIDSSNQDEVLPQTDELNYELTTEQLASRISISKPSFSNQKTKSGNSTKFSEWICERDPNNIYWLESVPRQRTKYYKPASDTPQEKLDKLLVWKREKC